MELSRRTFKRLFLMAGSSASFSMLHSTRHRIALTTELCCETLLNSKLWRPSPWHRMSERNRFSATEKRAHDIDLKYHGSTFTKAFKSNGKDGRYLVLVVGPFYNLSDDFMMTLLDKPVLSSDLQLKHQPEARACWQRIDIFWFLNTSLGPVSYKA